MQYVQERLPGGFDPAFGPSPQTQAQTMLAGSNVGSAGGDAIRRMAPIENLSGEGAFCQPGGIGAIVQQLLAILAQLLSALGIGSGVGAYFRNASASSAGDPHLAFDGTGANGQNDQVHFDSMSAQSDLLDSDSFDGGYRISTGVTAPGANGVTYNQSAEVSSEYGTAAVTLDRAGNAQIVQNGQSFALPDGANVDLGGGESVRRSADGSVVVTDENGRGGLITTTLSENGPGVDVSVRAQDVELGGTLTERIPR